MRPNTLHISFFALCLLPALALTACDPKLNLGKLFGDDSTGQTSDASTGQTSDASTTAAPETTTGDSSGGSTTAASETTTGDSSGDSSSDDTGEPTTCDIWAQNCPADEKCSPYDNGGGDDWDALKCVPVDPMPVPVGGTCENPGSATDGLDNCDVGSMCWDVDLEGFGTCVAHCQGTPQSPTCAAGFNCVDSGVFTLCLPDCDPLAQDCPAGQECVYSGDAFDCFNDVSGPDGQTFDPCDFVNACDPGLGCMNIALATECDPEAVGCCLPFCDASAPNSCPGVGLECVAWYVEGQAPAGDENIGICALPV